MAENAALFSSADDQDVGDDAPPATSKSLSGNEAARADGIKGKGDAISLATVTINKPRGELYAYFRNFAQLPSFMDNVERIDILDPLRSHWVVKAPGGRNVEWSSTITDDSKGALIAWQSDPGADVPNSGKVTFEDAPGGRGTVMTAEILYDPPAGVVGKIVAKVFQREPAIQARRDLRRFKQLMETGEIATAARTRAEAQKEKD